MYLRSSRGSLSQPLSPEGRRGQRTCCEPTLLIGMETNVVVVPIELVDSLFLKKLPDKLKLIVEIMNYVSVLI